jgi:PAS domain S-box-containing protein
VAAPSALDQSDDLSVLRAAFDSLPNGVLVLDSEARVILLNSKFAELWRIPLHDILREAPVRLGIRDLIAAQVVDREAYLKRVDEIRANPASSGIDLVELKDGRVIERTHAPYLLNGEKKGFAVSYREVTEEVKTKKTLEASEIRFRTMFEAAPMAMAVFDLTNGNILSNSVLCKITGYSQEEIQKISFEGLTYPEDFPRDFEQFSRLLKGEIDQYKLQKRYVRKDGSIFWGDLIVSLGRDSLGAPRLAIGIMEDITDRKNAEREREQLLQTEREARIKANEAVQLRDEFIMLASHELRTPITPLKLQVQFIIHQIKKGLAGEKVAPEEFLKVLGSAEQQLDRLNRLIEDLLSDSRISSGRLTVNRKVIDLSDVIHQVACTFKREAELAGCELLIDVDPDLKGLWDPILFERVGFNLVSNAIKFGRGKPVEISFHREGENARLTVRDLGIGIGKENHARIFERFERAVSLLEFGGFGLGLYITRAIVLAHGGSIRVESEPGCGACFIVEFPLQIR